MFHDDMRSRLTDDDKPRRLYIVATGAGAGIVKTLWEIPGASSFLVGANFAYHERESVEFAGVHPEKFASPDFALDLAMAAYIKALGPSADLAEAYEPIGLAVTAKVATTRPLKGEPRVHVACITRERILGANLTLDTPSPGFGAAARQAHGWKADDMALDVLMAAVRPDADSGTTDVIDETDAARARLFANPLFTPTGRGHGIEFGQPTYPGSFNPPHEGHWDIADEAERTFLGEPIFTVCATHPNKPALGVQDMLRRAAMLVGRGRHVCFTEGDPLYIDKVRARPSSPIIMGVDALAAMMDPKYGHGPVAALREIGEITDAQRMDRRFFVAGRVIDGKTVRAAEAIRELVPEDHRWMFWALPVRPSTASSTAIRANAAVTGLSYRNT